MFSRRRGKRAISFGLEVITLTCYSCWNQFQSNLPHRYGRIDQGNGHHHPGEFDTDMPDGVEDS